ncbi:MAG: hypothetical protein AB2A00_25770 [Myxococcota bacterium]
MAARKSLARSKTAKRPASRGRAPVARTVVTSPVPSAALRTGSPPVGSIGEDAIERLIAGWIRRPNLPADFARIPREPLLAEAEHLRLARADLPAFAANRTPINARAFDYLDVLTRMLESEPRESKVRARKASTQTAAGRAALANAVTALRAVLDRAEACGRPLRLFELSRVPWSESGLVVQLFHVVQAGRRRADKWDDPAHAHTLFTALEHATLELEAAWKLPATQAPEEETELRAMALHRLLYDAITYLSAYGRAVYAADGENRARYMLGRLFPADGESRLPSLLKLLEE